MGGRAGEEWAGPDRPGVRVGRSRGRSRSRFLRLWVRAPRMRMVSIAIGGGDLGNGGGGRRRIAAEPESVTSPRFGGKWRKLPACRSGVAAEATRGVQAAGIRATCMSGGSRELSRTRRSEEHTSELQSLMRISYAVFCLKKKKLK